MHERNPVAPIRGDARQLPRPVANHMLACQAEAADAEHGERDERRIDVKDEGPAPDDPPAISVVEAKIFRLHQDRSQINAEYRQSCRCQRIVTESGGLSEARSAAKVSHHDER